MCVLNNGIIVLSVHIKSAQLLLTIDQVRTLADKVVIIIPFCSMKLECKYAIYKLALYSMQAFGELVSACIYSAIIARIHSLAVN